MFSCRWLTVILLIACTGAACRKYIPKPIDASVPGSGGSGGSAGTGGSGGRGGTGGASTAGTGGTVDMAVDVADSRPPDLIAERPEVDMVNCGLSGQACCPGNACAGAGCCYNARCVNMGTACFEGATCFGQSCGGMCGGADQACCAPNNQCVAAGLICVVGDAGPNGSCRACGGVNQPCCVGMSCGEGRACTNNVCVPRVVPAG